MIQRDLNGIRKNEKLRIVPMRNVKLSIVNFQISRLKNVQLKKRLNFMTRKMLLM